MTPSEASRISRAYRSFASKYRAQVKAATKTKYCSRCHSVPAKSYCRDCFNLYSKERRDERTARGICHQCNSDAEIGKLLCVFHNRARKMQFKTRVGNRRREIYAARKSSTTG